MKVISSEQFINLTTFINLGITNENSSDSTENNPRKRGRKSNLLNLILF